MPALSWEELQEITALAAGQGFKQKRFNFFLETGTGLGSTCLPLSEHFDEVHTIELKKEFHEVARSRAWRCRKPVHFYCGPSEEVLPELLTRLRGPSIIFLDAHYSGEDTGRGEVDVPLLQELRWVTTRFPHAALVIIDDLRLFGRGGAKGDLDVDWSMISHEAVRACVHPDRVACSFPLEAQDRYVFGLRSGVRPMPELETVAGVPAGAAGRIVPAISTPGEMDMEALGALFEADADYAQLARAESAAYSMGPRHGLGVARSMQELA